MENQYNLILKNEWRTEERKIDCFWLKRLFFRERHDPSAKKAFGGQRLMEEDLC